jgi:O-antigen ligase
MITFRSRKTYRLSFFTILLLFFAIVLLVFGGASRYDEFAQIPVRLTALLVITAAAFRPESNGPREIRWPATFLACAIATVLVQLIPLPPGIWTAIPGRALFAEAAIAAGWPQPWRPLALSPDLALNALLSLVVPVAVLAGLTRMDSSQRMRIVPVLLVTVVISMIAVTVQTVTTSNGFSWVYRVLFDGWSPGIFTNRNHQALLLAIGFPLLASWMGSRQHSGSSAGARVVAIAIVPLLALVLLGTGSRAGLVLGPLGILGGVAVYWSARANKTSRRSHGIRLLTASFAVGVVALITLAVALGRAVAIDRLLATDVTKDPRFQAFPTASKLMLDYFPAGTGFGSFDPAFRQAEPEALLNASYMNQAHNDVLQIVLEGGLPGLLIMLAVIAWLVVATARLWRRRSSAAVFVQARAATVSLIMIVIASVVDYPLRTPIMMAVAAALTYLVVLGLAELKAESVPRRPTR